LAALSDHVEELLLELRRRVEVDLARQRDHVRVVAQLLRLDVEIHISPRARGRCRESLTMRYGREAGFGALAAFGVFDGCGTGVGCCAFCCWRACFSWSRTTEAFGSSGASFR